MPVCAQYQSLASHPSPPPHPIHLFVSEKGEEAGEREKRGATLFLRCVTYTQAHGASRHGIEGGKPGRHPRGSVISSLLFTSLVRASHTWLHTCTTVLCPCRTEELRGVYATKRQPTARDEKRTKKKFSRSNWGSGCPSITFVEQPGKKRHQPARPKRRLEKKVVIVHT